MLRATFDFDEPAHAETAPRSETADAGAWSAECRARASLYRLLGGVFVEEPSPAFLNELRVPVVVQTLADAGIVFAPDFLGTDIHGLAEQLACEYATLFASSGGFPPVESVRLTGRFKQEPHFQVSQIYRQLGFRLRGGRFEVFPDQLGVELMLVAELLARQAAALDRGDLATSRMLDKEIKRFWTLHLGRWVRGYCALVERAANHSFYAGMARLLAGFAQEEIVAMGLSHLDDLDGGQLEVPKSEIKLEFNPDEPVCGECPAGPGDRQSAMSATRVIPIALQAGA